METENTKAAQVPKMDNDGALDVEANVKVRVGSVLENIEGYRKAIKSNLIKAWLFCAVAIVMVFANSYFEVKEMLAADIISLVLYVVAFLCLLTYSDRATTARGKRDGALMVLETMLPEAFLKDDKNTTYE